MLDLGAFADEHEDPILLGRIGDVIAGKGQGTRTRALDGAVAPIVGSGRTPVHFGGVGLG